MEFYEIKATVRKQVGSSVARSLRRSGKMPAVFYGPETKTLLLSVAINDIEQSLKEGNISQTIYNIDIQDGETKSRLAAIKEMQVHPLTQDLLHADFYEIDMNRKIKVKIPVTLKGKAKGVELGGMLQIVRRELEVLCLPGEIPEKIEIEIDDLDIGDSVHVKDISIEGDVEILAEVNFTVITVLAPKLAEEEEAGEEEEVEEEEAGEKEAGEKNSEAETKK